MCPGTDRPPNAILVVTILLLSIFEGSIKHEIKAALDSKKLQQLLGLPLTTNPIRFERLRWFAWSKAAPRDSQPWHTQARRDHRRPGIRSRKIFGFA
jgi:hypothetical protein